MFASRRRDAIVRKNQLSVLIGDIGEELRAQSVSEKQEPTSEGPLLQLPNQAFSRALEASSPRLQTRNESCECTRSPRHPVPSARRGSPTTDLPPQRTQLSPHRCGLRCTPKNPGVTAEGYERAFVAPLDAAPVSRSATDSTLLQRMASEEPRCFGVRAAKRSVDADSDTPDEAPDPMPIRTGFHLVARVDRR
jgi:hypothetical protein